MIVMFRLGLVGFSVLWSLMVLPVEAVRLMYSDTQKTIATGRTDKNTGFDKAISAYTAISDLGVCMPGIREQLAFLLVNRAKNNSGPLIVSQIDSDLNQADQVLRGLLACSPFESNQWLSLASLDVKRNGIRDQAFGFLKLSYLTAPREGWIIERRLTFAVSVAAFLPDALKVQIQRDISEMEKMPGMKRRLLKRLNLQSLTELKLFFG